MNSTESHLTTQEIPTPDERPSQSSRLATAWHALRAADHEVRIPIVIGGIGPILTVLALLLALPVVPLWPALSPLLIALSGAAGVFLLLMGIGYAMAARGVAFGAEWTYALIRGVAGVRLWGFYGALLYVITSFIRS